MKLGELVVELSTKGNTKELEKTLNQLKEAEKKVAAQIKLTRDLAKAETEEEKKLIRKNHAQKEEIAATEKIIARNKERNKTILDSVKGFTKLISAISLAIVVLDRYINASSKANQNILTSAQVSGVDVETINKYASAAKSKNYNITREQVGKTLESLSQRLIAFQNNPEGGDTQLIGGISMLAGKTEAGKKIDYIGKNAAQFLEEIREPIQEYVKRYGEAEASYILSMMSIDPNLLPMLKMSKSEFQNTQNRFLSGSQMKEQQKRALELEKQKDELKQVLEVLSIDLIPLLTTIAESLKPLAKIAKGIAEKTAGKDLPKNMSKEDRAKIEALREVKYGQNFYQTAGVAYAAFKTKQFHIMLGSILAGLMNAGILSAHEKLILNKYLEPSKHHGSGQSKIEDNRNINIYTTQPPSVVIPDSDNIQTYQQVIKLYD